eukprot:1338528-Amorphochlora_amoeboformis.AAC.2
MMCSGFRPKRAEPDSSFQGFPLGVGSGGSPVRRRPRDDKWPVTRRDRRTRIPGGEPTVMRDISWEFPGAGFAQCAGRVPEMSVDSKAKEQLEAKLLSHIAAGHDVKNTIAFAAESGVNHPNKAKLLNDVVKSLKASRIVEAKQVNKQTVILSKEGKRWVKEGSPEYQIFMALEEPMDKGESGEDRFVEIGFVITWVHVWVMCLTILN